MATMAAAVCEPGAKKLAYSAAEPRPSTADSPDAVVVAVAYCGVCGTDVHVWEGGFPAKEGRLVMGHESSGVVVEVGENVKNVKVGERVVVDPNIPCNQCRFCRDAKSHYCATSDLTSPKNNIGVFSDGAFAEYIKAPSQQIYSLPDELELHTAALVEPVSCVEHGWDRLIAGGPPDSTANILICGGGIIGLLWSCLLHHRGYRSLTLSEPSEKRRQVAAGLPLVAKVMKIITPDNVEKDAYNVVVDCTGVPAVVAAGLDALTYGGRLLLFGCCPSDGEVSIRPFRLFQKELSIIGIVVAPYCFRRAITTVQDMARQGYLAGDLSAIGVEMFSLKDCEKVIVAASKGQLCKPIFKIGGS